MSVLIQRFWAMPSAWTFDIPPIKDLIKEVMIPGEIWADPFAGMKSPAQIRNDLNSGSCAQSHIDALEFLRSLASGSVDGCFYDPPYSYRQAIEVYQSYGLNNLQPYNLTRSDYWGDCKKEIARIVKFNGKAIYFGWNTSGISGVSRDWLITMIRIICHGGHHNDTLITVERKIFEQGSLF